jgi:hypothetical protein
VLGGIVGYFKFVKGRIYRPRIEPTIVANIYKDHDGATCLSTRFEIKNVGHSKVELGESTGVDLMLLNTDSKPSQLAVRRVKWSDPVSFRVFQEHAWIESAETIREEEIFIFNTTSTAAKLALHVAAGRVTVTAMKVVALQDKPAALAATNGG